MQLRVLLACILLVSVAAGWAQPNPDYTAVTVRVVTLSGTPVTFLPGLRVRLGTATAPLSSAGLLVRGGAANLFALFGVPAGQYQLSVVSTLGEMPAQAVTIVPGNNLLEARLPLVAVAPQYTLGGKPVTPRNVQVFPVSATLSERPPLVPIAGGLLDGLAPADAALLVLTDLGYALVPVTPPTGAARLPLTVDLQPGGIANLSTLDMDGQAIPEVPLTFTQHKTVCTLTTDAQGALRGLHLPVGTLTAITPWSWNTLHPEYRPAYATLASAAGKLLTQKVILYPRQTLTVRCTAAEKPAVLTAASCLMQNVTTGAVSQVPALAVVGVAGNRVVMEYYFPVSTRLWLFTDAGYGAVDFTLPLTQSTQAVALPLQLDGGTIDVTAPKRVGDQCFLQGKLPGQKPADPPVTLMLPLLTRGHWHTPQLPPGAWKVIVGTSLLSDINQTVTVQAGKVTTVVMGKS